MKLIQELTQLNEERLDEGMWRNLFAAAALLVGSSQTMTDADVDKSTWEMPAGVKKGLLAKKQKTQQIQKQQDKKQNFVNTAVERVTKKFRVDPKLVKAIAQTAMKYEHPDFPTAKDILGVVGTESSFNPNAKSQLKTDPAVGLMQIRPGVWGLKPEQLKTIDDQIKHGAEILRSYYKKLGSREDALHAYNVGITNHRTGRVVNPRYVPKVNYHKSMFESVTKQEFKAIVAAAARRFNLSFASEPQIEPDATDFWVDDMSGDESFGLGLSTDVYASMQMTDLIDKDNPAYEKIQKRLSKTPTKKPHWLIVGECANAILEEAKRSGLTALEVPDYRPDRYGEVHSYSKIHVARDIGWDHYPDLNTFDFIDWLKKQADSGAEEVEDTFIFHFKRDLRLDYHGHTPDYPD